jgi:hypothetical protein
VEKEVSFTSRQPLGRVVCENWGIEERWPPWLVRSRNQGIRSRRAVMSGWRPLGREVLGCHCGMALGTGDVRVSHGWVLGQQGTMLVLLISCLRTPPFSSSI